MPNSEIKNVLLATDIFYSKSLVKTTPSAKAVPSASKKDTE